MGYAGWVSIVDANDLLEGILGWGGLVHVNGRTTNKVVCVVLSYVRPSLHQVGQLCGGKYW